MKKENMKKIIAAYIKAYNEFDVDELLKKVNLELKGKDALQKQAKEAAVMFKEREMKITEQTIKNDTLENKIDFKGVLAMDIPDGPKSGETIEIKGKSIFKFREGKIVLIEDIS
jgi:hypothetical protein